MSQLCTSCHQRSADLLGLTQCVVCAGLITTLVRANQESRMSQRQPRSDDERERATQDHEGRLHQHEQQLEQRRYAPASALGARPPAGGAGQRGGGAVPPARQGGDA